MDCRAPVENRLDVRVSDHRAHDAFADRFHRAFGLLHVEEVVADMAGLDLPQHREIDVDDVLIACQHQRFLRHIAHGAATAKIETDVDFIHAQRMRLQHGLDRVGQVIIQPGRHLAHELAEAEHHAELIGLDAEESGKAPQHHRGHRDQGETAAAEIAGHQPAQPVLAAAQKFFEIGRFRAPRLWSRAPRAAALITPRHALLLGAGPPSAAETIECRAIKASLFDMENEGDVAHTLGWS